MGCRGGTATTPLHICTFINETVHASGILVRTSNLVLCLQFPVVAKRTSGPLFCTATFLAPAGTVMPSVYPGWKWNMYEEAHVEETVAEKTTCSSLTKLERCSVTT